MDAGDVATLRSFNRTVSERIGVLDDDFLARGRTLGASRLLWELAQGGGDVRSVRVRLGLDSGYVSRLLRGLEREGLVEVVAHPDDRRQRLARVTPAGRREVAELDRLNDAVSRSMLDVLEPRHRRALVDAAATVDRLMTAGLVTIEHAAPADPDARFCMESYFAELDRRFPGGFRQELSTSVDYSEFAEPTGALLVARLRGAPVGCGALKFHHPAVASVPDIKRMWISPTTRGLGVGRRLLTALEHEAERRGFPGVRLETNRTLTEAIALYRSTGYVEVDPFNDERYAHHWFEKRW